MDIAKDSARLIESSLWKLGILFPGYLFTKFCISLKDAIFSASLLVRTFYRPSYLDNLTRRIDLRYFCYLPSNFVVVSF